MVYFVWLGYLKAGLAQKSAVDLALGATGFGLAGASAAFAAYMIAHSDQGPRINGAEKLAIFAKPVSTPYSGGSVRAPAPEFDILPVGTVRARVAPVAAPIAQNLAEGYSMRGYSQGAALVQGPNGFFNVKVGAEIAGLGRVTAITPRGRSLIVITTGGVIVSDD